MRINDTCDDNNDLIMSTFRRHIGSIVYQFKAHSRKQTFIGVISIMN